MLLQRAMLGSVTLLQLETKLLTVAHVTTKSYVDVCGLCCFLKPSWYLWPGLLLGTMLMSLACTVPGDHAEIHGNADFRG